MASPLKVPRWTPSPSPTRSPRLEEPTTDDEMIYEEDQEIPFRNESVFPFSSFSSPPHPNHHPPANSEVELNPPTFQVNHEIDESMEFSTTNASSLREGSTHRYEDGVGAHTDGVFLTWENLWVTVSAKTGSRAILSGVTGYAQPGEVLAIMGPSGCGKSTLLDALSGRLDSSTRQSGKVLVNGHKQRLTFGTSAYVTQDDILMSTLTVREAVYYSALLQLPESMSNLEKRNRADATIQEMGLQDSMNTRIGGWGHKGISGGQKRRVSISIEILTRPKLLFLDEPTSGLDSAASYHVMKRIVGIARQDGTTIIASIHQPSTEVFQLFQNLCLLSSGKTVYFGPVTTANEFFSLNGFPCPTMMNPSDHFLRTINKDFDKDIEQGLGHSITTVEAIDKLVASYASSRIRQQVGEQIPRIHNMGRGMLKMGSQASVITQSMVLTRRSFVNMYRDLGYYWLRLAIYVALCLCVGTIYHDIGHTYGSIQARGAMLMFVAAFLTFMAIGGFPSFVEDMKIFGRERLNGHYGVAAFVFGNTFSSIPYLLLISLAPGAIAYYLTGLQKGFDHFVYFVVVLFACMMVVESLMMIVASIVPDFLMGIITGAGIQGVMMLNGGFFRLPDDLPNPFWKYPMYYIAFHKYANEGFYKNEFEGQTFPNSQVGGPSISGEDIMRDTWQLQMGYSKWIDLFVLLGMVVLYRVMFFGIIKTTEKMKPIIRSFLSDPTKQPKVISTTTSPTQIKAM
ncbi:ATP-binding cassette sub- G member 1 [Ranunculus cassubicifolius]